MSSDECEIIEDIRTFTDPSVCKEYLVAGVCLARLFEGTGVLSGRHRKGCRKVPPPPPSHGEARE